MHNEGSLLVLLQNFYSGLFRTVLSVLERLLGQLFGHDNFGRTAFKDLLYFGLGKKHLHPLLIDFILVICPLVIKLYCFLK